MQEKSCSKCGEAFPRTAEYFGVHKSAKDGLRGYCRLCHRADSVKRHYANRAENVERCRLYYQEHREQAAKYQSGWAARNPEKHRDSNTRWRLAHRPECTAFERNHRARVRNASGTHTAADVAAQRTRQKGLCYWCGEKVGRHYHVDHVTPLALGGSNGPENLVISCAHCNMSKGAKHPMEFAGRLC